MRKVIKITLNAATLEGLRIALTEASEWLSTQDKVNQLIDTGSWVHGEMEDEKGNKGQFGVEIDTSEEDYYGNHWEDT